VFSAIIITKGKTSVANVRDLAHSRPHFAEPDQTPDVFGQFERKLERLQQSMVSFSNRCDPTVQSKIIGNDARKIPLPDGCIDLIFTSPPYVNAIDYPRAHKFSIFWLSEFLHTTPDAYKNLGAEFVGTDRVPLAECHEVLESQSGIVRLNKTLEQISRLRM
jgi:hypothetical protein